MRHELTISLLAAMDQVRAKAHYLSMDRGTEGDPNIVLPEIIEDENQDLADRAVAQSMAKLREVIRIYVPVAISRNADMMTVALTLPSNYDTEALPSLTDAVTGYITASVMHDWLSAIRPAEAEPYAQQIVGSIADIRTALTARVRPRYENETPILDTYELIYPTADEA